MAEVPIHRVGIGTDLHVLAAGRALRLGGIEIPFDKGLRGHSDADVVLHAITDALLGAAGLPDIGERYPDSDPRHRGRDSGELLREVVDEIGGTGWRVVHLDVVIHAERPKLSAHKAAIQGRVAALLGVDASAVSIKAKTNEGCDAVGRGEAIGCTAVVGLGRVTR